MMCDFFSDYGKGGLAHIVEMIQPDPQPTSLFSWT
jgi:hypothetical protein